MGKEKNNGSHFSERRFVRDLLSLRNLVIVEILSSYSQSFFG
jgi:hypothetical protein